MSKYLIHEATRGVALFGAAKRGKAATLHPPHESRDGAGGRLRQTPFGHSALTSLVLCLLLLLQSGCGYSQKELFPEDYQSVAVPIFENRTAYRHVENDLSEALIKQIEQRTPYKVVAPATADTILQGTVTGVDQNRLSRRPRGGVPEEMEVTVRVDFEWKDPRTGEVLVSRRGLEAVGHHVPTRPVSEPFETAQHTAVQRLADQIVSALRSEW